MSKKTNKRIEGSGFPEDSYTENFIETQENQYNFDYKKNYDFESKARRPLLLAIINFIFSFLGGIVCLWLAYYGVTTFFPEHNIMGGIVSIVMVGGMGILMLMGAVRQYRKITAKGK